MSFFNFPEVIKKKKTNLDEQQRDRKKSMISRTLILHIVVVLWLIHLSGVASSFKQKPECKDQYCGRIPISFPFGIGENCSFDKWFEIDCKSDNGSTKSNGQDNYKPYLKSIGLEVTVIRGNTIRILVPVNFNKYRSNSSYDLRGTPFSFSCMSNMFVGISCNTIAYSLDRDDFFNVWCASGCSSDFDNSNLDYYNEQCEAELQQNIRRLQPEILGTRHNEIIISNDTREASGFGFLVDRKWVNELNTGLFSDGPAFRICEMENLPVVLEWEFYNATWATFGTDNLTTYCETKVLWFHVNNSFYSNSSLWCSCRDGYQGNPYLPGGCQADAHPEGGYYEHNHFNWKLVMIGVCSPVGALFFVLLVWWLYKVARKEISKRKKEKYFKRNGGLLLRQQISSSDGNIDKTKLFSSYELEKATDHYNIDRVLGQGGQGTVYKGMLSDGSIVAVKKSKIVDSAKVGQFINEVVILSQINHRNVVKLLGCCLETEVPLLVYEFILNGTLFQHIHNPNEDFPLTWAVRLRISIEVAGALSYMHSAASLPIYHRDIKSTNILLDEKYKARISDFGTSKSVDLDKTHFTTLVQGTFGYLDPEYFRSSQFTEKSDVYSFGVVLVELLTGQKPIFSNALQEVKGLALHFVESMEQDLLLEIIDPTIANEEKIEEMVAVAHIAKTCLDMNGKRRPTMKQVAVQLEGIRMMSEKSISHENYENDIENKGIDIAEGYDTSSTSTETW